jgi:multidrug resistance efflux pump
MSFKSSIPLDRSHLEALQRLRQFVGGPPAFWSQFTELALALTGAQQARCIVQLNGAWSLLASAPSSGVNPRAFLQKSLAENAQKAIAENGSVVVPAEFEEGAQHLLQVLHGGESAAQCLLELRFAPSQSERADPKFWAELLPFLADTPGIYQNNLKAARARFEATRMQEALDVLAIVNQQPKFAPASMALVNELSSRFKAERVCLGWVKTPYVRVVALSGTEKFERKMQILQTLEAAMEESRDQDEELLWPAPAGSQAIYHDHEAYSRDSGSDCLISVPLRCQGESVGVLTLEREKEPFTQEDAWGLRVIADQVAPRLKDLRFQSRWFGARWASSWRQGLAKLLSPRHTWLKAGAIVGCVALLFCLLVPLPYRVSSTFVLRPESLVHMPAPFEGFIASTNVRPGDLVEANQVLVSLDDRDLLLEKAETLGEIRRFQAQAELAEANRELAEFRISQARLRQAEARLELIDHRLSRSDIRAPFASVVVQGDLRERIGAPVQQGEVLVQLSELEGLYLQIRVPERDIDLVGDNRTGAVVFASRPDLQFPFEIRSISPAARIADEGNIFAVRAALVETAEWMTPGMTGVAKIDSGKRTLAWRATHRIVDFIRMRIWF